MLTNTFVLYFYFGISQQPISKSFAKSFATIVANPQNHIDTYICIQYIVFLFWHFPAAYCKEFCEKFWNNCCKCRGTSRQQKLWPILRTINNKRRSRYICRNNPKYLKITIKGVVDKFAETTQNICNNKKQ